ncbi:MAG: hypothetical protein ACTHOU_09480, partial [Aureliella sp.]
MALRRIRIRWQWLCIGCGWLCLLLPTAPAQELSAATESDQATNPRPASPPIVGGFERFARHGDVPAEASGRLLLSELSCTACHAGQADELAPKAGPRLESAGRRLRPGWIAAFLNSPNATKPGTTMPDVLGHLEPAVRQHAIEALVAFLASQRAPLPELKATGANPVPHEFWNNGDAAEGERLVHQVGCVACHEPSEDYEGGVKTNSAIDRLLEEL